MTSASISVAPPRRASDPGAPRLRADVGAVVALGLGVVVAGRLLATGSLRDLAVLGGALVLAELLPLRMPDGSSLPLSYALVVPAAFVLEPGAGGVVVAAAAGAGALISWPGATVRLGRRLLAVPERGLAFVATAAAMQGIGSLWARGAVGSPEALLVTLLAGAVVLVPLEATFRALRAAPSLTVGGSLAALAALAASGMLMAAGYAGLGGAGAMGPWAIAVFAVPALAARWAFGRLHAITRTYDQTIHVLSVVPEMGGRVRPGHSERVRDLCAEVGAVLGLPRAEIVDLERAALLHALGHVTLEEPGEDVPRAMAAAVPEVADATVDVLGSGATLSRPAGLVARLGAGRPDLTDDDRLAGDILKAVATYEDLSGGNPAMARPALQYVASARGCVDDRRVVAALARVVTRRDLLGARA